MYKDISNNPEERICTTYSWAYWDNAFSEEELKTLEEYCQIQQTEKATVVGTNDISETEKIRKSKVKFHSKNEQNAWFFNRVNQITQAINESYYNYNLNGYSDFQYTEYHGNESGEYTWHMDMLHGQNKFHMTRKLSLVLCLSDPERDFVGGEFQINSGNQDEPETILMKKGRMIFFPSYIIHRVKPVTKGIRKTIVIWITGPKFV
jgi:PKHD-type hydroxylase